LLAHRFNLLFSASFASFAETNFPTQRRKDYLLLNFTKREVEFGLIQIYQGEIGRGETTCFR